MKSLSGLDMSLYEAHPDVYDSLYMEHKDYAWEAQRLKEVLPDSTETMLVVGCGTGLHDEFLKDAYEVTGVDLSPSMLDRARERNPEVRYEHGDIRYFDLDAGFDAVLCLFTVVNYVEDSAELKQALKNMALHLKAGPVIIDFCEAISREDDNVLRPEAMAEDDKAITRTGVRREEGDHTVLEWVITVASEERVTAFRDYHRLLYFSEEEYREAFREAGLDPELVGDDWPLWVATTG